MTRDARLTIEDSIRSMNDRALEIFTETTGQAYERGEISDMGIAWNLASAIKLEREAEKRGARKYFWTIYFRRPDGEESFLMTEARTYMEAVRRWHSWMNVRDSVSGFLFGEFTEVKIVKSLEQRIA